MQSKEYIDNLTPAVADRLLLMAYDGVHDANYEFTDLASDTEFVQFMMKNRQNNTLTSTDDDPTSTTGLGFLHLTLQQLLSAIYNLLERSLTNERICSLRHWHSDLGLSLPTYSKDIVFRFLAGLCNHSSSFSCQQVGDLVFTLSPFSLQASTCDLLFIFDSFNLRAFRCVYESDSIVQESQKIQNMFNTNKIISIRAGLPFDYYLIGHCICHHGGMWSITSSKKDIKLLVQGLKSCVGSPKGKLLGLSITNVDLLELYPILVSDLQDLTLERVTFTEHKVNIIRKCISSLRSFELKLSHCEQVELLFPIVFESSLLDIKLFIYNKKNSLHITDDAMNLLINNSNLKHLRLHFPPKLPAHTVCHNESLDFLAKWLLHTLMMSINFKNTLPYTLSIGMMHESSEFDVFLYFEKFLYSDGTCNRKPEMTFRIELYKSCEYNVTQQIFARIPEHYLAMLYFKN